MLVVVIEHGYVGAVFDVPPIATLQDHNALVTIGSMATAQHRANSPAIEEATKVMLTRLQEVEEEATALRNALRAIRDATNVAASAPNRPSPTIVITPETKERLKRSALLFAEVASAHQARTNVSSSSLRPTPTPTVAQPADRQKLSMRQRVLSILEEENRYFKPAEIAERIEAQGNRDRRKTDEQFLSAIRTALWQLRNSGDAAQGARGGNIAVKWILDGPVQASLDSVDSVDPGHTTSVEGNE